MDEVAKATRLCRDVGLKICYHFMPNLPGSDPIKDIKMAKMMFTDPRFEPDYLKVYPAMTIKGTKMYEMWKLGEYRPYSEDKLIEVLKAIKAMTPVWCRIDRLVRDISKKWVSAGTARTNLRQVLQQELIKMGKKCECIRCREVRGGVYDTKVKLLIDRRDTLGGKELFLSYESQGKLFSMLRLRLPDLKEIMIFDELKDAAIVREVHTYGQVVKISKSDEEKTQHRGLGKLLMAKAEAIAKKSGYSKLAVISAIGTREYYKNLGYKLKGTYMVKNI